MAERINTFRELRVYSAAISGTMGIFELPKSFPSEENIRLQIKSEGHRDQYAQILERPGENADIRLHLLQN